MKWTTDQQKVIDLRNRNILVSAAAGSGKTAVLVERIIQIVTNPKHLVDIDHLLIVTFTNAAAGEMRERIGNAIEKRLLEDRDNLHLQKQMTLIHSAQITTIHSFCLGLIRNYFNQINLDPGFRIGDEAELRLMKSDVLEEVLEGCYERRDKDFLDLVESYATGKSDHVIMDMVLKLHTFSMSYPDPRQWMEGTKKAFAVDSLEELINSTWMKDLLENITWLLEDAVEQGERAISIALSSNGPYMYEEALLTDKQVLTRLKKCRTYEDFANGFGAIEWKRLSAKKDETVDVDKREYIKELRNGIKAGIEEIRKQYFYQGIQESFQDILNVKPAMDALVHLTLEFSGMFARKKQEKNLVDFNDLEHFALEILVKDGKPSQVAMELSEYYEEILVDEYQDSNLVQETLVNSISKEKFGTPNLFMVGDVKQSIYKFRLARPELFLEKYNTYSTQDGSYQRIDLHKNFRSRDTVISGINRVFEQIMHHSLGNIEYDKDAALFMGASYPDNEEGKIGGITEIMLLDGKEEITSQEMNAKEKEAQAISVRIKELLEEGFLVYDKDHYRKANYGDMVILLRSMSGWAEVFASGLMEQGIPAFADTQTGYFSAVEVQNVLNLLLIIDNPLQDIPLSAVLRSAIGNISDEELSMVRIYDSESNLFQSLCAYVRENAEQDLSVKDRTIEINMELREKLMEFLHQLEDFQRMLPFTNVYDLLQEIYKKTGYYNYVSVLPSGEVRSGNLDMLLQKALDFENTSYQGLFHFNRYIEKLHQYEIDFGEAGMGDEGKNAVRIMSIHRSKGLEFPIVFLGGMGKMFNQQDARSRLILHPDLGIGPDYVDYKLRTKVPTLLKKIMQKKMALENLGEELRVLYVAMTRAKEKLILIGQVRDLTKKLKTWEYQNPSGFRELSSAGSYLDWIMPCAIKAVNDFIIRVISVDEMIVNEMKNQISAQEKREQLLNYNYKDGLTSEIKETLLQRLTYQYPYLAEQEIKSKISVSELKKKAYEEMEEATEEIFEIVEEEAYIPDFAKEEEVVSGAGRGTLYHKIMECHSFNKVTDAKDLEKELDKLNKSGKIEESEIILLNRRLLLTFFESSLGKRMVNAQERGTLKKEQPFVLGIKAGRVVPELKSEELVIVQGIIDAFFEEDGEIVLMDYKTDRALCAQDLISRYKLQFDYYQEALEQITGKKVKERILYSFSLAEEIRL